MQGPLVLDVDTATPYLVAQGLIDSAAIIDGELTITSVARRNRNLKVQGPAGKSYLTQRVWRYWETIG
jgi:hypothetical protein